MDMKIRKSIKANLENKRGLFRDLGLMLGVLIAYGLMTYQFSQGGLIQLSSEVEEMELDSVVVTFTKPETPPKQPDVSRDQFEKVDNTIEVPDITFDNGDQLDMQFEILEKVGELDTEVYVFTRVESYPFLSHCEGEQHNDARWECTVRQIQAFINSEYRIPEMAVEAGIGGRAWVNFIVEADGSVGGVSIYQSSGDELIDQEAVRVVKRLPLFTPAKVNGGSVRMQYTVPINVRVN